MAECLCDKGCNPYTGWFDSTPPPPYRYRFQCARVVELVDTTDLKSVAPKPSVPVRFRSRAPRFEKTALNGCFFYCLPTPKAACTSVIRIENLNVQAAFSFRFSCCPKTVKIHESEHEQCDSAAVQAPCNRTAKHAQPITVARYRKAINFRPKARQIRTKANGRHKTNRYFKER